MTTDFQDRIDDYVLGRMTEAERRQFEDEVSHDSEKKEQLELTRNVKAAICSRQEKLDELSRMKARNKKTHRNKTLSLVTGIAAILVIGFFAIKPYMFDDSFDTTEIQRGDGEDVFCPAEEQATDSIETDSIAVVPSNKVKKI